MNSTKTNSIIFVIMGLIFVSSSLSAQTDLPWDKQATKETINLYHNLKKLMNKGFMMGHQDDLAYGVGWKYEDGRSDIKRCNRRLSCCVWF